MSTKRKGNPAELAGYVNISMFRCLSTKQPPYPGTMEQVYQLIVSDAHLKEQTERYRYFRAQGFEADADRIKRTACPAFTPAALFEGKRQYKSLVSFTGYSMVDYDHLTSEQLAGALARLAGDPYWVLVYVTLSGRGRRIIFRVEGVTDRGTYAKAFLQGNAHYARLLGLEYDGQVCDATRMSGLCHDPKARYRPTAEVLPVDYTAVTVGEVLPKVERRLRQRGIVYGAHSKNEYISQACYLLNKYGVAEADAMTWAASTFTDYADEGGVERIVRSCYGHREEHATLKPAGTRAPRRAEAYTKYATVAEIEEFLEGQAEFRFNTVTYKCELRYKGQDEFKELTDRDGNTLWSRMYKAVKPVRLGDLYNVLHCEFVPEYNPFRAYFDSLPTWDGQTDHIAGLARSVHLADPSQHGMFTECLRKWLVAMVASLLAEEVINHEILVFIGPQGAYKTTWFRRLLPPPLYRYFYTKTNSSRFTKDDLFTLTEFALMCFEELETMNRPEMNQLKALITLDSVNERAAYGRNKERRPHIASFCGTGNNIQFLSDPTGTRRWLPFEVSGIDDPYQMQPDYDGIYSQTLALLEGGFKYWFDQEDIVRINRHNAHFEVPNLEEELILTYYAPAEENSDCSFLTISNILERVNLAIKQPLSPIKLGLALKKLGFIPKKTNGRRGYLVVERNQEEVRRIQKNLGHYLQDPPKPDQPTEPELPF